MVPNSRQPSRYIAQTLRDTSSRRISEISDRLDIIWYPMLTQEITL
jgi:hypothetical protein